MRILNFGSCNIDYVYSLEHIVENGETEKTYDLKVFPGGKGLNQSIAAAKAGANVFHAGCIGNDGEILEKILIDSGTDISYLKKTDVKSGHAIIQVNKDGDNAIFVYSGSNEMITCQYIDTVFEKFGENDIVLLQNEISNIDYIVEKAYEKDMCVILNPSPVNHNINKINFGKLTYIILNETELKAISKCGNIKDGISYFKSHYPKLKIVLTLGKNGSIYIDSEREFRQSAFKVEAVDTTAAGDTFTGYFVAGLSAGKEYEEILKTASAASAVSVSRKGAAPSIPDMSETLFYMKKLIENSGKSYVLKYEIENYIETNIKNANLNDLAKLLGYSAVYTGRLVKELCGESFVKILYNKRCEIAAEKLLKTNLPIENIIEDIGYENKNHFRKIFKAKYGKNPLEYRKGKI